MTADKALGCVVSFIYYDGPEDYLHPPGVSSGSVVRLRPV
ncbi:MAG: hypothetical protein QOD96_4884, partial [Pseudonocardiales bacterium]|nr:hypothetical protein [Pseudonocardiales bacterium]